MATDNTDTTEIVEDSYLEHRHEVVGFQVLPHDDGHTHNSITTEQSMETSGYDPGDDQEEDDQSISNPIIEINLIAGELDNFAFLNDSDKQYIGLYHKHMDGTLMTGEGVMGAIHEINPDEIIIKKFGYQTIQAVREIVADLIYKSVFDSRNEFGADGTFSLTDVEVLELQTTIRDGKKQTGRNEDEPLVFFKKDRNTLESQSDLNDKVAGYFNGVIDSIWYDFANKVNAGESITKHDLLENGFRVHTGVPYRDEFYDNDVAYGYIRTVRGHYGPTDNHELGVNDFIIASKVEYWDESFSNRHNNGENDFFINVLNLSQITKVKIEKSIRIDPGKARETLDTNIFELFPNQTTRQDEINNFFRDFDNLIGPAPMFSDVDGDGSAENVVNYDDDEESRISHEVKSNSYITRLDSQVDTAGINSGKTIQGMRNRLNTYLGDVDNVIEEITDQRPEYENKMQGFLKIRKPNQAIILRAPNNEMLDFQKDNSYLTDGFTITMWVRFVSKTGRGTLFNFGNPTSIQNPIGFRLETISVENYAGNYRRIVRLVVRDHTDTTPVNSDWGNLPNGKLYDSVGIAPNAIDRSVEADRIRFNTIKENREAWVFGDTTTNRFYDYPQIDTSDLNEWYFICATYNPNIDEEKSYNDPIFEPVLGDYQFWLNHVIIGGDNNPYLTSNSGVGARCKVEIISRSDLLRARGYKTEDTDLAASAASANTGGYVNSPDIVREVMDETEEEPPQMN